MVIVDTSIWVSHLRLGNRELSSLLDETQVMSHDFIIGELACGNLRNRKEVLSLLKSLPPAPVMSQEEVLYFMERHSLAGKGMGFVDVHLLASAQLAGVFLWTSDGSLKQAASALRLSYGSV